MHGKIIPENRGRKALSLPTRQAIFDLWHEHSIVTVDRRTGRDEVSIKSIDYHLKFKELSVPDDMVLGYYTSKRNQSMVKTTKRIWITPIRHLQEIANKKLRENISLGLIINLKPFYVQQPPDREKESCLCRFCLNLQLRFNELLQHLGNKSKQVSSLSEYFSFGISCPYGDNGYY